MTIWPSFSVGEFDDHFALLLSIEKLNDHLAKLMSITYLNSWWWWQFGQTSGCLWIWWPFGHAYVHHSNFEWPLAILLSVGEFDDHLAAILCLSTNLRPFGHAYVHHLNIWCQFGHPSVCWWIWWQFGFASIHWQIEWWPFGQAYVYHLNGWWHLATLLSVGEFDDQHLAILMLMSITQTLNDHWPSFCLLMNRWPFGCNFACQLIWWPFGHAYVHHLNIWWQFGHHSVCWWIWWPFFGFASIHWNWNIEWPMDCLSRVTKVARHAKIHNSQQLITHTKIGQIPTTMAADNASYAHLPMELRPPYHTNREEIIPISSGYREVFLIRPVLHRHPTYATTHIPTVFRQPWPPPTLH